MNESNENFEGMSVASQIKAGLQELIDALKKEEKIEDRFRVSRLRKVTNPKSGEQIVTRVVTEPKK